ncbi:Ankyrin-1 [Dactylella cylindrospora]|nr:Ankyrin-1 [Dactylella cylindrospora]
MSFAYQRSPQVGLRCRGVIFLGTPHRGSAAAQIAKSAADIVNRPAAYIGIRAFFGEIRSGLLEDLTYDSPRLTNISKSFQERAASLLIFSFYERELTKPTGKIIVDENSAILDVPHGKSAPLWANHRDICRFEGADSDTFKIVLKAITEMAIELKKQRKKKPKSSAFSDKSLDDIERNCMELLNIIDMTTAHQTNLERYVPGTLEWLRPQEQYSKWFSSTKASMLWISGLPGCGKSILSSHISDQLSKNIESATIVCKFFCNAQVKERQDPIVMFRSIIYQIVVCRRRLLKLVRKARTLQGPQLWQQLSGLWELLSDILKSEQQRPIIIIIDALDECEQSTQLMLVNRITSFISQSPESLCKFIITTRPSTPASLEIPPNDDLFFQLNLEHHPELIGEDVTRVIKHKLDALVRRKICPESLRDRLETVLNSRAENTFMWVSLVLLSLETKSFIAPNDIQELQKLPRNLSTLYQQYLEKIPEDHKKIASDLFRIIVCSQRPLKVEEVNVMLDYFGPPETEREHPNYDSETITRLLYPFVQTSDGQLVLIHQSVREFLLELAISHDESGKAFGVDIRAGSLAVAKACMTYLLSDRFDHDLFTPQDSESDGDEVADYDDNASDSSFIGLSASVTELIEDVGDELGLNNVERGLFKGQAEIKTEACTTISRAHGFYDYAARHWTQLFGYSCELPESDFDTELHEMAIRLFDLSNIESQNWLQYFWALTLDTNDTRPEILNPLVLASYFGHSVVIELLEEEFSEREIGHAVHWAARQGNISCLKSLLKRYRGEITSKHYMCSVNGLSPLAAAVQFGHLDCTEFLLGHNIFDMNMKDEDGQTPLSLAVTHGHSEIAAVLLKQDGIDPNLADRSGSPPLFWITACNSQAILSLLLKDKRVNPNYLDKHGRNVLSWVAEEGQTALAKKLISDKRIDVNNLDSTGRTPILWAVQNNHPSIVKLLIDSKRVDISVKDKTGRNIVSWAAERRGKSLIPYLIKKCPKEVDVADEQGWTPLAWALNPPGYYNNAVLLLHSGLVDINYKDITGRSPLSFAVGWGYPTITETFLRFPGVEANCVDAEGITPIFEAVKNNNRDMMKVLLNAKGVDINFKNRHGRTALSIAAGAGQLDLVQMLLSAKGIDKECVDLEGHSALWHAEQNNRRDIIAAFSGLVCQ